MLAPAGGMESVYAAVGCGADSVYLGGRSFSARAKAANFDDAELSEAVKYCHLHGVSVYLAMNTLIFHDEEARFVKAAENAARAGVDALIIQDLGAARLVKSLIPDMRLHASTQMSIHTVEGALTAYKLGFSRVVIARELKRGQIEEICRAANKADIEIEAFVHGALCASVSGQCYMSAVIGSRSANRGNCAQPCRLPYTVNSERGAGSHYPLSLKDLCLLEHIGELRGAGVACLKIEGRMKRPEYVAAAVSAYRAALDGRLPDFETLRAVFSRSGFTDGYFIGKSGSDMLGIRQREDAFAAESVLPGLRELYRKERESYTADFHMSVKKGEKIKLSMRADGMETMVCGEPPQAAERRAVDTELIKKQLSKLGSTAYKAGCITVDTDEGLSVSVSQINAMRRSAAALTDNRIIEKNTPVYTFKGEYETRKGRPKTGSRNQRAEKLIRILLYKATDLTDELLNSPSLEKIILPIEEALKIKPAPKIILSLPRFVIDETALLQDLKRAAAGGFDSILCNHLAHIGMGAKLGFKLHGGMGLNLANPHSLAAVKQLGLADAVASFECTFRRVNALSGELPLGIFAYGFLPLMLLTREICGGRGSPDFKNTPALTDRTGRALPIRRGVGYSELLNADLLLLSDKLDEVDVDFILLDFFKEPPGEILEVIERYKTGAEAQGKYTRGYRVVF